MIYPGIDIVDLNDPLLKVRGARPQALITHPDDAYFEHPNIFWFLWSAKEAVFKSRREKVSFAPKSIPVTILIDNNKNIVFHTEKQNGIFEWDDNFILAVTQHQQYKMYFRTKTNWKTRIRAAIQNETGSTIGTDEYGLPFLRNTKLPISISHHGDYGAYAV